MDRSANLDTEELKVGDPPGAVAVAGVGSRPALPAAGAGAARALRGAPAAGRGAKPGAAAPRREKRGRAAALAERGFPSACAAHSIVMAVLIIILVVMVVVLMLLPVCSRLCMSTGGSAGDSEEEAATDPRLSRQKLALKPFWPGHLLFFLFLLPLPSGATGKPFPMPPPPSLARPQRGVRFPQASEAEAAAVGCRAAGPRLGGCWCNQTLH